MKRLLSTLLIAIMLVSLCGTLTVFASDTTESQIIVQEQSGFASQAVSVTVNIEQTMDLSAATLKINYDTRLELLSVQNGSFFPNITNSMIPGQKIDGENGEYTYIGFTNGENLNKMKGTLLTLTFKIPDDAKLGDTYDIKVASKQSKLITGIDGQKPFAVTNGKITVTDSVDCQHTFPDYTVVSGVADYVRNSYKYRTCTSCGSTEVEKQGARIVPQLFTYEGVCINYTGKPSGIAPIFTVDADRLSIIASQIEASQAGISVEAGLLILRNGEYYDEEIFFGNSTTVELKDGKLFTKITDVSVFDKFEFKAYIRIIDTNTKEQRDIYTNATYKGSEEISILDVAQGLKISVYEKEHRDYLNKVIQGLAQ